MTTSAPYPDGMPDAAEIRAALERLLANPAFSKSPQLAQFLSFVVEETLAGRSDRIKAYTVAADAFGRDASFDPQNDPIVRVEAGRLRRALEHYYATDGRHDAVVIELPLGGYVPVFRANNTRRHVIARMYGLRRIADALPEKYRLVMLIVIVAGIVSVTFDLLEMLFMKSVWPAVEDAMQSSPPATASPDSTGSIKR